MGGIFGYFDRGRGDLEDDVLADMGAAMAHRGPGQQGIHHAIAGGGAIGGRRLAAASAAAGPIPYVSDDGLVAVVQDGAIYNHVELAGMLRRVGVVLDTGCEAEVILRLYEREGIDFVSRLNGMFAIAIEDSREDAMYLVRDRIGVKPLFVADDGERVLFASEINAILPAAGIEPALPSLDMHAIHHYLSLGCVPPPWTVWKGVRHLMPGTWMRCSRTGTQVESWWSLAAQREKEHRFDDWSAEFLSILDDATRVRLPAGMQCGAFLNGGVDASTIVALMTRHVDRPVKTFCLGFDDPLYDEAAFAREAARRFACDHTSEVVALDMLDRWPQVLQHLDQPHADASFLPTLRLGELASRHVSVAMSGDGADELFAGHPRYTAYFARRDAQTLPVAEFGRSYFEATAVFAAQAKEALYQPAAARLLAGVDSFSAAAQPWLGPVEHFGRINQALYLDMQLLLPGNTLVRQGSMGTAASIETRSPFLDWRMMEFAFRSRGSTKLWADDRKHWYKRAAAPLMGGDLAYRGRPSFEAPMAEWFRGHRHDWLAATLENSPLLAGLFRRDAIQEILARHRDGAADMTRQLQSLLALALWGEQALA